MPNNRILGLVAAAMVVATSVPAIAHTDTSHSFGLRGLAPHVQMITTLPGEAVALEAVDESQQPLKAHWTVPAGTLTYGAHGATWEAPDQTGLYRLQGVATMDGHQVRETFSAFVTVPSAEARSGALMGYKLGRYPELSGIKQAHAHALPAGFIRLDSQSAEATISRSFHLGQFAVKDGSHGAKYMMLSPRLLEKLERIIDELNAEGHPTKKLRIMSGYRTPAYNSEIGNKTSLSRHTYGDASDILADDWDHDGAITQKDAQILYRIADKLDHTTDLTGGLSLYKPNGAHGWFVHVDTRGKLARW